MTLSVIQHSFHAGEFAPALTARVDLAKYKSGLALASNCFVDYRGGVSTRMGTKYILQCGRSDTPVRLIPFQASFSVAFILEFGEHYIRFFNNGNPVVESPITITNVSGNIITAVNSYHIGDWVLIEGVGGLTDINGRYFYVSATTPGVNFTILDLFGNVPTFGGAYTAGGTSKRVYQLSTPYTGNQLALLKFAQNVDTLVLCHPDVQPQLLTYFSSTNWTLSTINFGSTISTPSVPTVTTTLAGGTYNYSYVVTAVDANGQESGASSAGALNNVADLRTNAKSNTISWSAVAGASSYNVYKAEIREGAAVPAGASYGFIGNCKGTDFIDSNIPPDFSQGFPIPRNPFLGAGVDSVTITTSGSYAGGTAVPSATFGSPTSGTTAAGQVRVGVVSFAITANGTGYTVGQIINIAKNNIIYAYLRVTAINGSGGITAADIIIASSFSVTVPADTGVVEVFNGFTCNVTFGVTSIVLTTPGSGYTSAPSITFSSGAAAATAVLSATQGSNPTVPSYTQQRLVLAGLVTDPQQFNFSQPGLYFNFDVTSPIEADDAIQGTLAANQLNNIKSIIPMSLGLVVLTDKASWLINGGSQGSAITPFTITANEHSTDLAIFTPKASGKAGASPR